MDKVSISQFSLEKNTVLWEICVDCWLQTGSEPASRVRVSLRMHIHPPWSPLLGHFHAASISASDRGQLSFTKKISRSFKGLSVSGYCLETGVPQGSLLEALVFFLHIRDHMHKCAVSVCAPRAYMLRYIWNIRWQTQPYNKGLFIALPVSIIVKLYGLPNDQ